MRKTRAPLLFQDRTKVLTRYFQSKGEELRPETKRGILSWGYDPDDYPLERATDL